MPDVFEKYLCDDDPSRHRRTQVGFTSAYEFELVVRCSQCCRLIIASSCGRRVGWRSALEHCNA
jgi:hypothetical protein